jgi:hypothetical protein
MTQSTRSGPELKAPAEDGQVLLWPGAKTILSETRENHRRLGAEAALVQNVPLNEARRQERRWIGHANDEQPLIATGHQIELYHPGVWAKDAFMNELAGRVGGEAYHFAVDTDAPKHLQLRWLGGSMPITDDERLTVADWAGSLDAPTPRHLAKVEAEFAGSAKDWPFAPLVEKVLSSMRRLTLESTNLTWVLTNALHQLDWDLGLRQHAMLVSPIWMSPGYLLLAHHVLAHAERFAAVYNRVLGEFRRENLIRNAGRPWPDLKQDGGKVEAPFWVDSLGNGERMRGNVEQSGGKWALRHGGGDLFEFDAACDGWEGAKRLERFLNEHLLRLSPRALTLTMFIRLMLTDQFVHGIGGGRYDRITDRVIEGFFGVEAPAFSVTTATLYFPTAAGRERIDLAAMEVQGRRIRHGWGDPAKREMAAKIVALPRGSRERRDLFYDMHAKLENALSAGEYRAWEERIKAARSAGQSQRELFDRELFFAIQPTERLQMLIERYHGRFESDE